MRSIITIVGLTGLCVLSVGRIGWAEERWVLWQEKFRPSREHRWRPVGTDPGERECEALKQHLLVHMSREPEFRVRDGMITQTVPGDESSPG